MTQSLDQKVVLITGGAHRVGAATARRLHAAGARLMVHYRSSEAAAQALQAELNALRADSVALVQADLLDIAGLPELVKNTVNRFGGLDVLVNNASSFFPSRWATLPKSTGTTWSAPISGAAVPVTGRSAGAAKSGGCIINIVDIHSERPLRSHVLYNAAKAGLAGLTRSLARELGPEVRVNGVSPGAVLWPENDNGTFDTVTRQRIISATPLKRAGDPEDIARTVLFLAADAPFITGQIIAVDGGRSVHI